MSDAVSRLEQRVRQAIERIGELGAERDELVREVRRLQGRIEQLESAPLEQTDGATWAAHRRRTLDELREILGELRAG